MTDTQCPHCGFKFDPTKVDPARILEEPCVKALPSSTQSFLNLAPRSFLAGEWTRHDQFVGFTGLGKAGVSYQLEQLRKAGLLQTREKSRRKGSKRTYCVYRFHHHLSEQMPNILDAIHVTV